MTFANITLLYLNQTQQATSESSVFSIMINCFLIESCIFKQWSPFHTKICSVHANLGYYI